MVSPHQWPTAGGATAVAAGGIRPSGHLSEEAVMHKNLMLAMVLVVVSVGVARAQIVLFQPPALVAAVMEQDVATVHDLLVRGADVNQQDARGRSSLVVATAIGNLELVELLIKHDAKVNLSDRDGNPPLYWAAELGDPAIVLSLLESGAHADRANRQGITPLMAAARGGHVAVVQQLIDAGADLNATDYTGRTPLLWAAESRNRQVETVIRRAGER